MRSIIFTVFLATLSKAFLEQTILSAESQQSSLLTPEIDKFVSDLLDAWNSSAGISIAVVQKRQDGTWNTEMKGYGVANAAGDKVNTNTLFGIGSNSKVTKSRRRHISTISSCLMSLLLGFSFLTQVYLPEYPGIRN